MWNAICLHFRRQKNILVSTFNVNWGLFGLWSENSPIWNIHLALFHSAKGWIKKRLNTLLTKLKLNEKRCFHLNYTFSSYKYILDLTIHLIYGSFFQFLKALRWKINQSLVCKIHLAIIWPRAFKCDVELQLTTSVKRSVNGRPFSVCAFLCILLVRYFRNFTLSLYFDYVALFHVVLFSCFASSNVHFLVLHSFHVALFPCCTLFWLHFLLLHSISVVLFPCWTFPILHFFLIALFSFFATSFTFHFFPALFLLYSCCTLFALQFFHVAFFSNYTFFCVAFFSCFPISMLHFFRVALFSCCTIFILLTLLLALFHAAFLCCTLSMLHSFHVTLS